MEAVGIPYLVLIALLYKMGYLPQKYYFRTLPSFPYRDTFPLFYIESFFFEILSLFYLKVVLKKRKRFIATTVILLLFVYSVYFFFQVIPYLR